MHTFQESKIMRVFVSSTDKYEQKPLYEFIVLEARKQGLAGATVLKGIMGFGSTSTISTSKFWEISEKIPVIVEIIDKAEKVDLFYEMIKPFFLELKKGIMVTLDKTNIVYCRTGEKKTLINKK